VRIEGGNLSSDLRLSVRDDLPVDLVGGIDGRFTDEGLYLSGGLELQPRDDANPSLRGRLQIGYEPESGLRAEGDASIVLDSDLDARAGARFRYQDGSLMVQAEASAMTVANDPVVDFQAAFGGKGVFESALDQQLSLPIFGVPYLNGAVAELELKANQVSVGGRLAGLHLQARLAPWDVLADEPPDIHVQGGFDDSDLALGMGLGMHMRLLGTVYGLSAGIKASANLQSELAVVEPEVRARLSWASEGGLGGLVTAHLPLQTRLTPSAVFRVVAGVSKYTLGVPGTKATWKGAPVDVELMKPLDMVFPVGSLKDPAGSPTADLDHLDDAGALDALKMAVMDSNPELGRVIQYVIMATDIIGDVVGDVEAWASAEQAWFRAQAEGREDEAWSDAHRVRSMMTANMTHQAEIQRHLGNLQALLGGGVERADPDRYRAELGGMVEDLVAIVTNLQTLQAMDVDVDSEQLQKYQAAQRAVVKRMERLARG